MKRFSVIWERMWITVAACFVLICIFSLLNEILDLPHLIFNAPQTPVNWQEVLIECIIVVCVGLFSVTVLILSLNNRKRAEEELHKRTSRLKAILASVPDIIMEVDANKVYTWANRTGYEFFGDDVIGKEASYYFEGEQDTYYRVKPLFNGDENIFYVESWQRRRDGEKRLLAWWCRALKDERGNVVGALSTARDITERKQAEEEIRRLNEELEQRVIERTAQLEEVNKELEAFTYSASHDLRAPLRRVDGFGKILLEEYAEKLDEQAVHYLNRIRASTQQMGLLIDDLINLSRLTRIEMKEEKVDLTEIVKRIATELQSAQSERKVEFAIQDGLFGRGDERLLTIALENIVINAWKFTANNPNPKIEFGLTEQKGVSVFFVRDNGIGFDMSYIDKLFTPFQRLHSTSEFPGTGIGLATVKRIIHRHGGRLWAEGKPGEGATFYFTLPESVETKEESTKRDKK